jgi:hypothetical protein
MRTDETTSYYERYLSIRHRVEHRTLEQGMVQTFAPPVPGPWESPRRSRRRRPGAARAAAIRRSCPRVRQLPQLALDLV